MVVLNGGSSSGKTTVARCLQELLLPRVWLRWSIDDLVGALPGAGPDGSLIEFPDGGAVVTGPGFRRAEAAWVTGLAAMARAGAGVIVDDVFLGGSASQERLRSGLGGLQVLWVGVRCDPAVASSREAARGDRNAGMAALQAHEVHADVTYDVEVDTTAAPAMHCARILLAAVDP